MLESPALQLYPFAKVGFMGYSYFSGTQNSKVSDHLEVNRQRSEHKKCLASGQNQLRCRNA